MATTGCEPRDGRQNLRDGRAGRLDRTVAESSVDELARLVRLDALFLDDLLQLRRPTRSDVLAPFVIDVASGRHPIDERLNQFLLVTQARTGIDGVRDGRP